MKVKYVDYSLDSWNLFFLFVGIFFIAVPMILNFIYSLWIIFVTGWIVVFGMFLGCLYRTDFMLVK